jgi:tetratricopeptide (TPR) repeat protein
MIKLLVITFWMGMNGNDIAKINQLKADGEEAFKSENYQGAIENYSYLIDTLHIDDEQIAMNLGHAYYQLGNKDLAQSQYQKLVLSEDQALKSLAYQQLGAISNDPKMLQKALSYFKESVKSDPTNEDARYNYELVKKKLKEQENQNQDQDQEGDEEKEQDEKENQDEKESEDKENKDGEEGDKSEENKDSE